MPRKKANIHYLYKTTCLVTGRYYIGMHSTTNLNDGYMGSGKRLRYSIRKYGKENHIKEILGFFDSRELLIEAEKKVVSSDFIQDENCMNLKEGGLGGGGFLLIPKDEHIQICKKNGELHKERLLIDKEYRENYVHRMKLIREEYIKSGKHNFKTFLGKKHTEKTKLLIGKSNKNKQKGQNNSQFGTCWITNGFVNKKIKINELSTYVNSGWYRGRI